VPGVAVILALRSPWVRRLFYSETRSSNYEFPPRNDSFQNSEQTQEP
jgi:hypothetical protein